MHLKGHTKIELTNVHTNEKEVYEDDNMFTNVLETLINISEPNFNLRNISTAFNDLFGGLALFKNPIDTNDVRARLKNRTVAAVVNNNYAPLNTPYNGVPDSTLSKTDEEEKTMTFSYDFLTSQANGVISAVCMGSVYLGFIGYGFDEIDVKNAPKDFYSTNSKYLNFISAKGLDVRGNSNIYVDLDEGYHYTYSFDASNILKITRTRIKNRFFELFPTSEETRVTLDTTCNKVLLNPVTRKLWCMNEILSDANDMYEIDITDFNEPVTVKHEVNNNDLKSLKIMAVTGDYLYARNNTSRTSHMYRLSLTDTADITDCGAMTNTTFGTYGGQFYPLFTLDDGLYICDLNGYGDPAEGIVTDRIEYFRLDSCVYAQSTYSNTSYIPVSVKLNDSFEYVSIEQYGGFDGNKPYYVVNPLLLYTINNLSSPVTKTADKTMKITYTITQTGGSDDENAG